VMIAILEVEAGMIESHVNLDDRTAVEHGTVLPELLGRSADRTAVEHGTVLPELLGRSAAYSRAPSAELF
jgi:hypothetical protein